MKETLRITGLCCTIMGLVLAVGMAAPQGKVNLEGVYEFVRLETPDGPQTTQKGMLIASGGYICHLRVANEREAMSQDDSDDERTRKAAAAFRAANTTCGSYTMGEGKITANWKYALNPATEGNQTEFLIEESGGELKIAPAAAPQFKFVYKKK